MNHADYLMPLDEERCVSAADLQRLGLYIGQLGQLVAAMQARLDALEKENARRVTLSHNQVKALNKRIGIRADDLCAKYQLGDAADVRAFRAAIRKMLLTQYAIRDLHDLPLSFLDAAGRAIDNFSSIALVRERREKHGTQEAAPQPGPGREGAPH